MTTTTLPPPTTTTMTTLDVRKVTLKERAEVHVEIQRFIGCVQEGRRCQRCNGVTCVCVRVRVSVCVCVSCVCVCVCVRVFE